MNSNTKNILYRIPVILLLAGILVSCVNDLESIKKVTFDPKAPDEASKNLRVFFNDSSYARVEIYAKIAQTYSKPESITQFKDGIKVNFFSEKGEIVSTLLAKNGEINNTKGNMFVSDSVQLINYQKNQRLETDRLFWNQKDSSIYSTSQVVVKSKDGMLFGDGIRTKQDFSEYEFLRPRGKINLKNNK